MAATDCPSSKCWACLLRLGYLATMLQRPHFLLCAVCACWLHCFGAPSSSPSNVHSEAGLTSSRQSTTPHITRHQGGQQQQQEAQRPPPMARKKKGGAAAAGGGGGGGGGVGGPSSLPPPVPITTPEATAADSHKLPLHYGTLVSLLQVGWGGFWGGLE